MRCIIGTTDGNTIQMTVTSLPTGMLGWKRETRMRMERCLWIHLCETMTSRSPATTKTATIMVEAGARAITRMRIGTGAWMRGPQEGAGVVTCRA
jgi:hypothetical protein